jgi:serine protease Do
MSERESSGHRHTHIIMILLSVLVGAAITLVVLYGRGASNPVPVVHAQMPVGQFENAFVNLAAEVKPAVVSITTKMTETEAATGQVPDDLRKMFPEFPFPFGQQAPGSEEKPEKPAPRQGRALGSGWVYTDDGYIVTNSHVVRGATDIRVRLYDREGDEKDYPARLIGNDPRSELAVIKVDAGRKLPTIKVGDSKNLKVGEWVMAVGSPFELEQTVTVGVVSAKGRFISGQTGQFRIGDIVQTDASINPGNSGGPLVNLQGEVIGVNVAILSPGLPGNVGIGFAIPAETVQQVVPVLKSEGKIARGWLGVAIEDLNENKRDFYKVPEGGVLVTQIREDGPAKDSGLQAEDVIVSINGEPVKDTWALQKAVGNHKPGDEIGLGVVRAGKPLNVKLKLGATPAQYAGAEKPEKAEAPAKDTVLGLTLGAITAAIAQEKGLAEKTGVYVTEVDPNSSAAEKGMEAGDCILKVNATETKTIAEVKDAIEAAKKADARYVILRAARKTDQGERQVITFDLDLK